MRGFWFRSPMVPAFWDTKISGFAWLVYLEHTPWTCRSPDIYFSCNSGHTLRCYSRPKITNVFLQILHMAKLPEKDSNCEMPATGSRPSFSSKRDPRRLNNRTSFGWDNGTNDLKPSICMLRATRWRISICARAFVGQNNQKREQGRRATAVLVRGYVRGRALERRGIYGLDLGGNRRSKRGSGLSIGGIDSATQKRGALRAKGWHFFYEQDLRHVHWKMCGNCGEKELNKRSKHSMRTCVGRTINQVLASCY